MRGCETTENRMFLVRAGLRLRIESMSEKRTEPERVSGSYIYRASNIPFHGDWRHIHWMRSHGFRIGSSPLERSMHGSQYLAYALIGLGKNGNKAKKGICSINSNVSVEGYRGFLFNRNCKISCLPSIQLKKKKK